MDIQRSVPMPVSCVVDGRKWRLFSVDYTTAEGEFSTYIYALSREHAAAIVEELRSSARLGGQIEGFVPA